MSTMKKYSLILFLLLISSQIFGQGIYNNGGKIVIGSGVILQISGSGGNFRNENDGSVDLSGTLKLTGNLTNNVASNNFIGTAGVDGAVVLNGSTMQTMGGTSASDLIFPNLEVNNATGIAVSKATRVNGTLTLTNGLVDIETNNLTLSSTTTVVGTPSSNAMIVATDTGEFRKEISATGTVSFPIGDNTSIAEYSPVTLNFVSGTFAPGAYVAINLKNAPFAVNSPLKRYWIITQSGITSFVADANFKYVAADVSGNEASMHAARVLPSLVNLNGLVDSGLHQFSVSGLSEFGTFTTSASLLFALQLKLFIEGYYDTSIGAMRSVKYNQDGISPTTDVEDITVELRNSSSPYALVDMATATLKTNGDAACSFSTAPSGNYFIAVKGINSIETWSALPVSFTSSPLSYDFTTTDTKAYGFMKQLGTVWTLNSGDINHDGGIDASDATNLTNDIYNSVFGVQITDLNGDGGVDASDYIPYENNTYNSIYSSTPINP